MIPPRVSGYISARTKTNFLFTLSFQSGCSSQNLHTHGCVHHKVKQLHSAEQAWRILNEPTPNLFDTNIRTGKQWKVCLQQHETGCQGINYWSSWATGAPVFEFLSSLWYPTPPFNTSSNGRKRKNWVCSWCFQRASYLQAPRTHRGGSCLLLMACFIH